MLGIKTKIVKYLKNIFQVDSELKQIRINPMGYACNHQCPMCWRMQLPLSIKKRLVKKESTHLSLTEYAHIIDSLPRSVKVIEVVGGGEPLLYSNITELLRLIKCKNIFGSLITNGSLLNKQNSKILVDCAWDKVRISFHAGSPKIYKIVNGVNDYFRVLRNIKYLTSIRKSNSLPRISLLFVIQHDNIRDIKPFVQQAIKLGVDELEFDYLIPITPKKLLLSSKERQIVVSTLRNLQNKIPIQNNIDYVIKMFTEHPKWNGNFRSLKYYQGRYCQIVQSNLDIASDGSTVPCCLTPMTRSSFNVKNSSVIKAWIYYRKYRKILASGKFFKYCYQLCNYELENK